ncbi:AAA family ATPase [Glutamicibacter sp. BW77]|uniref:ATP-dependent nuclease n=1 Tax=Glutamicibacter TaxID=1742989 RepID=UPI000BB814D6|nr:AAA family ATPase [Glutamicibacter sp. BW77]PCC36967.1 ATP-dependent endonuclease [Glutamicibacter sp. BW77]
MRISQVQIRNFRSLVDATISFDAVTTFIGPNGVGKSSVLRALDWFFNGGKNSALTEHDCSFGNMSSNIEVRVTFSGLEQNDRDALGKYAPNDAETFTAWKIRRPDGSELLSANAKGYPPFAAIRSAGSATDKRRLYQELRATSHELGLPAATSGSAVDQALQAWESSNNDMLEDNPENLQTNFFGFNGEGVMSGIFDFVLVTADLRASEESVDGRGSIISRILERGIDRTAADEDIDKIVKESLKKQNKVYKEKFADQLKAISTSLNDVVASFSPGRTVRVNPAPVELKPPKTTFDVSILDGETITSVDRQGHGFQRTLLIAALQLLAKSGASDSNGVICLAVEEPELFQHPIQAQAFARVLRSLAEDPKQNLQVTYATHSPYFVESNKFHQIRRLVRSGDSAYGVRIFSSTLEKVKARVQGSVKAATVDRQLSGTISSRLPVALFANRVLLAEGTTEVAVFHGLADRHQKGILETTGVAVVDAGGKSNIPLTHAILDLLGIPVYAIFDADGGFEDRARKNGKTEEVIENERIGHIAANKAVMKYFALHPEDFPSTQELDAVAILDDHLEAHLSIEWPEWEIACKAIEVDAGISLKKNHDAYRNATLLADGSPSKLLASVVNRASGHGIFDLDDLESNPNIESSIGLPGGEF